MKYIIRGFDKKTEELSSEFEIEIQNSVLESILGESLDYGCIQLSIGHEAEISRVVSDVTFDSADDYFIYS